MVVKSEVYTSVTGIMHPGKALLTPHATVGMDVLIKIRDNHLRDNAFSFQLNLTFSCNVCDSLEVKVTLH